MTGQERYEYRPDDGGRSPYGVDEAGGHRRRGPAQPDSPDAAGSGGYDPLGIRRSPADLAGVADPPRGGDPYGGYDRDGYADQPRGGRSYQADPYDAPGGGYDRDPYARQREDRPGPDDRGRDGYDRGAYPEPADPYGRGTDPRADRGGYPEQPADRGGYAEPADPYGRGTDPRADRGGYPPGRETPDDRGSGGYADRGGYGRGGDDRGGEPGGYPPARDDRGYAEPAGRGGYAEPADPYGRGTDPRADRGGRGGYGDEPDPDAHRRGRRDDGYGYPADPLGVESGAGADRGFQQARGGDPRRNTDPRYARQGGGDPRIGDPESADPRAGRRDPRDAIDDPRGASGWDRDADRPPAGASVWEAIVEAEREYYDSGDDHRVPFPTFYPRRGFALAGPKMLIGRRSESRGIHPDIDLSGAPEDPGISRSHALFEQLPDGGYAVRDPGSTNGTRLNDEPDPIEPGQSVPLRDGDRVYLGAWTRITLRAR
ncbi:FHA domain-containing protein [Frankia sp. AiPs1]|uniref:FHA domain-containing protein n=1 Tax=Frankia sp. AiPa1 TaxID=573492 RepID=UPI00202B3565|nr:FHA domain-containing protein [Frankia sp. AiPa1]MCL9759092.1 FHA domain-containing protein [Frankia sp. AiPa1]